MSEFNDEKHEMRLTDREDAINKLNAFQERLLYLCDEFRIDAVLIGMAIRFNEKLDKSDMLVAIKSAGDEATVAWNIAPEALLYLRNVVSKWVANAAAPAQREGDDDAK